MADLINYTVPEMPLEGFASNPRDYDGGWTDGLYTGARDALDGMFSYFNDHQGFVLNEENLLDLSDFDMNEFLWDDNRGPIAFMITTTVLALIMTIVGIGWCCKRCCCRDRGCFCEKTYDPTVVPKKTKGWKKHVGAGVIIFFAICFLYGNIIVFKSNDDIRNSAQEFADVADLGLSDVRLYLNVTTEQINYLFLDNYELLAKQLENVALKSKADMVKDGRLSQLLLQGQTLNDLTIGVQNKIDSMDKSMKDILETSSDFKSKGNEIQIQLQNVKTDLLDMDRKCETSSSSCVQLWNGQIQRNVEQMSSDLTSVSGKVDELVLTLKDWSTGTSDPVLRNWRHKIDSLKTRIGSGGVVNAVPPDVIEFNRVYLRERAKLLTNALADVPIDGVQEDLHGADDDIDLWSFVWWICMVVAGFILLLILTVMTFSLLLGIYGKEPKPGRHSMANVYFSKKTASPFINCGILTIFIFFFLFSMVALLAFTMAGVGGQIVCEAIYNMSSETNSSATKTSATSLNHKLYSQEITRVGLQEYNVPSYTSILRNCKADRSGYVSFDLVHAYDINELAKLSDQFTTTLKDVEGIDLEIERLVQVLNDKEIMARFDKIYAELSLTMETTQFNDYLSNLTQRLKKEAEKLSVDQLKSLEILQSRIVDLFGDFEKIMETATRIYEERTGLSRELNGLTKTVAVVQDTFHTLDNQIAATVKEHVDHYSTFTIQSLNEKVGQCLPLYRAFEAAVDVFCENIVEPTGGFWLGMSIVILAFMPLLIAGWILGTQYSMKYKKGGYRKCCICF